MPRGNTARLTEVDTLRSRPRKDRSVQREDTSVPDPEEQILVEYHRLADGQWRVILNDCVCTSEGASPARVQYAHG